MSNTTTPIYPGLSVPKYYSAINSSEKRSSLEPEPPLIRHQEMSEHISMSESERINWSYIGKKINMFCIKHIDYICFPFICVILIFILYLLIIFIGLIYVLFNIVFEKTMVFIIGRAIYNKNFPICTNTTYLGSDCYTATSTYCT